MNISELRKLEAIKPFLQHGFIPTGDSPTQVSGTCPFCHKEGKFFVNKESKAWDCKVCGEKGGYKLFMQKMAAVCSDAFSGSEAIKLSKSRGLSLETLRRFNVGYNARTNGYTLPIAEVDGEALCDLRIYSNGRLISTSGAKTGLFNAHSIKNTHEVIWLCEGEWDGMAMAEILTKMDGDFQHVAVAVPGAATFKPHWITLMRGKVVNVLYDCDKAGREGSIKVYNLLKSIVKELHFLHWADGTPEGYDIRDLLNEKRKHDATYLAITKNLSDKPQGYENKSAEEREKIEAHVFTGEGMNCEDVYAEYQRWLHIPDPAIIDVMYGAIIANRLPGDPLWLFLIAPPGMTKTEFIQSASSAKAIECMSTLSAHSLVSGATLAGGVDPSMIPKLDGKVLLVKDFTTILNMNQQAREEIFGILRDAYDGEMTKIFGNGVVRHYVSTFGIVAGVTPAIESVLENESALGERFLRWEMDIPGTYAGHLEYVMRASENVSHEDVMRAELRAVGSRVLDHKYVCDVIIPEQYMAHVHRIAIWCSILRGTIIRDKFTREVMSRPFCEMGTRLSKQFVKFLYGVGMFRRVKEIGDYEMSLLKRLARTTIPSRISVYLNVIIREFTGKDFTAAELSDAVRLPGTLTQRTLENLYLLGVLEKSNRVGLKLAYKISDGSQTIISESGLYT
jgi:hypothetical protein